MNKLEKVEELTEQANQLIESNQQSLRVNINTFKIIKGQLIEYKEIVEYMQQEFQALNDKNKRSTQEESQYLFLCKKLIDIKK